MKIINNHIKQTLIEIIMKILITGASGYIGSCVYFFLIEILH